MQQEFTEGLPESQWLFNNFQTRFWKRVIKTEGCWNWNSPNHHAGFISRGVKKKIGQPVKNPGILAYRASWIMHFGVIPYGMYVCHKCDNRKCVRPDHLFLGNAVDNAQDMLRKKRAPYGEYHPSHKVTFKIVDEMRALFASGMKQADIARLFNLRPDFVCRVVHYERWRFLPRNSGDVPL